MSIDTRYNKLNLCPVCNTGTKGCSHDSGSGVYLCRGGNPSSEFKLVKLSSDGLFGIYLKADQATNQPSLSKEEIALRNKAREAAKLAAEAKRNAQFISLDSVDARGKKYSSLSNELSLSFAHQQELTVRGCSSAKELGFRSINNRQRISATVDNLPGFENGVYKGYSGLLCPISHVSGQTVGYQIRPDDRRAREQGKYRWLRVKGSDVTCHLQNGEQPINVSQQGESVVGFCEGILKSTVAASLHNATIIGMANLGSSPLQLKEAILALGLTEVVLFPDSGSAVNKDVMGTLSRFNQSVESLGLSVKVADWGHWFNKESNKDIDELENLDGVSYVDFSFFKSCSLDSKNYTLNYPEIIVATQLELANNLVDSTRYHSILRQDRTTDNVVRFEGLASLVYQEAINAGHRVILDTSATGSGKTHSAAELDLSKTHLTKEIYCSKSVNDVNHPKLELEFTRLPSRHSGYTYDQEKLTPLGQPTLIAANGEVPDIESNCKFVDVFKIIRDKNLDLDVCGKCPFKSDCTRKSGNGYGYKSEMKVASRDIRLRATVSALSDSSVDSHTLLIVDEYSQSVPWLKDTVVTVKDVEKVRHDLIRMYDLGDDFAIIHPEALLGRSILDKLLAMMVSDKNRYGLSLSEVISHLSLDQVDPTLLTAFVTRLEVSTVTENSEMFSSQVNKSNIEQTTMLEQLLAPQWFSQFISTITRESPRTSLVIHKGRLLLQSINQRVIANLNRAGAVIYQDATGSKSDLALRLNIAEADILEVRQVEQERSPVVVNQILGLHKAGNERSKTTNGVIQQLREVYTTLVDHPDEIGFIEYKKFAKPGDLIHFSDGRGSNRFLNKKVVMSIGTPTTNISAAMSYYQVLTGEVCKSIEDEGFQTYLANLTGSEVIQEVGRLRANRRPNEELEYVIVSDADISFMATGDKFIIEKTHIYHYVENACGASERLRLLVLDTVNRLQELNPNLDILKLSQSEITNEVSISQSSLSKLSKKFGGWYAFKKVIKMVIHGIDAKVEEKDRQTAMKAQAYLPYILKSSVTNPEIVDEMLGQLPKNASQGAINSLFECVTHQSKVDFVTSLINVLPTNLKKDFTNTLKQQYNV